MVDTFSNKTKDFFLYYLREYTKDYVFSLPHIDTIKFGVKVLEKLPYHPGIYFCAIEEKIVYIGQTSNLFNRWTFQSKHSMYKFVGKMKIYYQECKAQSNSQRELEEILFISLMIPKYNIRINTHYLHRGE